jgi:hypothetical protein
MLLNGLLTGNDVSRLHILNEFWEAVYAVRVHTFEAVGREYFRAGVSLGGWEAVGEEGLF